jgi:predicted nicotinamide N-methyase
LSLIASIPRRSSIDLRRFIRANLPLGSASSLPEALLHRANPSSGLSRLAEADEAFGSPYWAYPWAGGLALARHILDHRELVAHRRVLDLGAGSGIVAIAAAKAGASEVVAADTDPYAIVALELNAAANGVALSIVAGDLTGGPPPAVDLIVVGDLFYDGDLAKRVGAYLDRCLASGVDVLIGDPWRAFLPLSRLRLLAEYRVSDFGDARDAATRASGVFSLRGDRQG